MKTCVMCGADLPTPLDTFGDRDCPVCQSCWLTPDPWALEIFKHEYGPTTGAWLLRKGRDYDMFFDL